jgi:hypothetical protein
VNTGGRYGTIVLFIAVSFLIFITARSITLCNNTCWLYIYVLRM